jgi:hypothetical protein
MVTKPFCILIFTARIEAVKGVRRVFVIKSSIRHSEQLQAASDSQNKPSYKSKALTIDWIFQRI